MLRCRSSVHTQMLGVCLQHCHICARAIDTNTLCYESNYIFRRIQTDTHTHTLSVYMLIVSATSGRKDSSTTVFDTHTSCAYHMSPRTRFPCGHMDNYLRWPLAAGCLYVVDIFALCESGSNTINKCGEATLWLGAGASLYCGCLWANRTEIENENRIITYSNVRLFKVACSFSVVSGPAT